MIDVTSLTSPSPGLSATLFSKKVVNPTVPKDPCDDISQSQQT